MQITCSMHKCYIMNIRPIPPQNSETSKWVPENWVHACDVGWVYMQTKSAKVKIFIGSLWKQNIAFYKACGVHN